MPTTVNAATASASDDICSICYYTLPSKRIIRLHPCQHQFHRTCIMSWFESRQQFLQRQFTCCLCRTFANRHIDESGQHVPPMLALEVKENENDFANGRRRCKSLVKFWTIVNRILENLEQDKLLALRNDKCNEYVADIEEEMETLRKRAEITENIFVSHSLRMNHKIKELNANMRSWVEIIDQGERTMDQMILLGKNIVRASSELSKEKYTATTTAKASFRDMCESEITAAAAARAAVDTTSLTES